MTEKVRVLPGVGSVADLVRCLRNITDLYEELQGHPTASSREARAALRTQDSQSVNVGNNCSEDGQRIAGTDCGSGLVERLREFSTEWEKLAPRLAAARGGDLAEEAAEALAAAKARITAKDEALEPFAHYGKLVSRRDDAVELSLYTTFNGKPDGIELTVGDFRHAAASILPTEATSLPALLAETRKKALEEAAAIDVPFPRTLGEAMLESPFKAVERYRAAIRSLLALQENSNER